MNLTDLITGKEHSFGWQGRKPNRSMFNKIVDYIRDRDKEQDSKYEKSRGEFRDIVGFLSDEISPGDDPGRRSILEEGLDTDILPPAARGFNRTLATELGKRTFNAPEPLVRKGKELGDYLYGEGQDPGRRTPLEEGLDKDIFSPETRGFSRGFSSKAIEESAKVPAPIDLITGGLGKLSKLSKVKNLSKIDDLPKLSKESKAIEEIDEIDDLSKAAQEFSIEGSGTKALSAEELSRSARGEKYYMVNRNGEITYMGSQPDPTKQLKRGQGIVKVEPGKDPIVTQSLGEDKDILKLFNKTEVGSAEIGTKTNRNRASQIIEDAGGKEIEITGNTVTWTDANGNRQVADLSKRFGKRNVGTNPRSLKGAGPELGKTPIKTSKDPTGRIELDLSEELTDEDLASLGMKKGDLPQFSKERGAAGPPQKPLLYDANGKPIQLTPQQKNAIAKIQTQAKANPIQKKSLLSKENIRNVLGLPSELKFSIDLPALRQSIRPTLLHPKSSLPAMRKALMSVTKKGEERALKELGDTPTYKWLDIAREIEEGGEDSSKLLPNISKLKELASSDLEYFPTGAGGLGEKIPLLSKLMVNPSRRTYNTYQRTIRGKELERIAGGDKGLETMLKDPSQGEELGNIVRRVNEETGHGSFANKGADKLLDDASMVMTAPRNLVSKAQFYNPLNYFPKTSRYGSGGAYKDLVKDQAKFVGGLGAALYGADKLGVDVEPNPLSANFPVKFGNVHPDILGGEKGLIQTPARMLAGESKSSVSGKEYDINPWMEAVNFARKRLRPGIPSMLGDLLSKNPETGARENVIGEDISKPYAPGTLGDKVLGDREYSRWVTEQFTPAYPEDVAGLFGELDPIPAAAMSGLGLLGMGSNTYDPANNPYRAEKKFKKVFKKSGDKDNKGKKSPSKYQRFR